ncbi:MAG: NAD(P)H-hydrate dehydratase [Desulfuromonadaceae bacterium]|nr:NAD(P)H-hydrate dehydratase [Desulfuromonas sp.]MDY0184799.1 NAD(P)H-hydrate dehydratase [Desulfuromonadaceae bacterium]
MKLVTAAQMREMDNCAIETYGVPAVVLMENAGRSAADILHTRYHTHCSGVSLNRALIFSGKGNNGGDGYVIARHLQLRGWEVQVVVLAHAEALEGSAAANLEILQRADVDIVFAPDSVELETVLSTLPCRDVLIIDAMFGNGLTSALGGHYLKALHWINAAAAVVAAVDMPSGVDATSGEILGEAVKADCSISFACAKVGQVSAPAYSVGGTLYVADIGMPRVLRDSVADTLLFIDAAEAQRLVPPRRSDAHKGDCGHSLIIAGTPGKGGAAQMAAEACVRSGSGLVTLVTPAAVQDSIAGHIPEVMTHGTSATGWSVEILSELEHLWQERNVVAVGPGLGLGEECTRMVRELVTRCPLPLVLDADGLNVVATAPEIFKQRPGATVVTPHPGEMARLCGCSVAQVQAERVRTAQEFAAHCGVIVVLKGARTVVADPYGAVRINSSGNPGMASGGMGDVLTGVITAFIAQGLAPFDAATLGVYLHGCAADMCALQYGSAGYTATDVAKMLGMARQNLTSSSYSV